MIRSFRDQATEDLFDGRESKAALRRCPRKLWPIVRRKLDHLNFAADLHDLAQPPGNRLHALHGDRAGQHAIAVNDRYRVCFVWTPHGPERVEITDYH